jgi:hypothetical protein
MTRKKGPPSAKGGPNRSYYRLLTTRIIGKRTQQEFSFPHDENLSREE